MKLLAAILSIAFAFQLCAQTAGGGSKAAKTTRIWSEATNVLWLATGQSRPAQSKETPIRFEVPPHDSFKIPIVALVDGVTGNEWIGKKADLYVENGRHIVGISLPYSGMLLWDAGLLNSVRSGDTVDGVIARFETDPDLGRLIRTYDPVTDLRPILGPGFFSKAAGADPGSARIRGYKLVDGELQLEMESDGKAHTATVWVDVEKRSVVKVIKDGEQILPK